MHAWEAIEGALDFIEEHLQEDISTEALAQSAGPSPFYFQRLFKRLTGRPVLEYVKMRRLAMAASVLPTGKSGFWMSLWSMDFPAMPHLQGRLRRPTASHRRSTGRTGPCSTRVTSRSCP